MRRRPFTALAFALGALATALASLGGCAASLNELRATHAGFEVELTQVGDGGGRACAPLAYAKAEAEHAFSAIEFVQGDVLRAQRHMAEARKYLEVAKVASVGCQAVEMARDGGTTRLHTVDAVPVRSVVDTGEATDTDGDGVLDAGDRCPSRPEDLDGFADEDGCPDLDNDGDGIADVADLCPNEAEDVDGTQDTDGCIDADDDGDGIADVIDVCPKVAETFNGLADSDGCPDEALTRVNLERNRIVLLEPITFQGKTAELVPGSYLVLNELSVFLDSEGVMRVRIESHTEATGDEAANQLLTEQQAQIVVDYLVQQGVARNRMEVVGYGSRMPIDSNRTPEGRQRNRRIEIYVIP